MEDVWDCAAVVTARIAIITPAVTDPAETDVVIPAVIAETETAAAVAADDNAEEAA